MLPARSRDSCGRCVHSLHSTAQHAQRVPPRHQRTAPPRQPPPPPAQHRSPAHAAAPAAQTRPACRQGRGQGRRRPGPVGAGSSNGEGGQDCSSSGHTQSGLPAHSLKQPGTQPRERLRRVESSPVHAEHRCPLLQRPWRWLHAGIAQRIQWVDHCTHIQEEAAAGRQGEASAGMGQDAGQQPQASSRRPAAAGQHKHQHTRASCHF